jgi:hypothetical protein
MLPLFSRLLVLFALLSPGLFTWLPAAAAPAAPTAHLLYLPLVYGPEPAVSTASAALKKGVSLTYGLCQDAAQLGVVWDYAYWGTPYTCPGVDNVPMAYNTDQTSWPANQNYPSPWLLGFNEPDMQHIDVNTAAVAWHQLELKFPNKRLVAPAPSHLDYDWVRRMHDAYVSLYGRQPRFDALAAHCYMISAADVANCQTLVRWFEARATEWGVPGGVWLTEFAVTTGSTLSVAQQLPVAQQFLSWLDAEPGVTRYAWWTTRAAGNEKWLPPSGLYSLLVDYYTNQLTTWGRMYAADPGM